MVLTILIAAMSAVMLLFAGYLLGVNRGVQARECLRAQLVALHSAPPPAEPVPEDCLEPLANMFTDSAPTPVEDSQEVDVDVDVLPEPEPEQSEPLSEQLVHKHREALAHLMNDIAETSQFKTVLLSNANGMPLAASRLADDLGRLAAISGYVVIFGEHIRNDEDYRPVSLLFSDVNQHQVLSRIFAVGEQRLVLSAVAIDSPLSLNALDPALSKVLQVLNTDD